MLLICKTEEKCVLPVFPLHSNNIKWPNWSSQQEPVLVYWIQHGHNCPKAGIVTVLDLARIEIPFRTAAHILLCNALIVKTALIYHFCFAHFWALLAQHPESQEAGDGWDGEGTLPGQLTWTIPSCTMLRLAIISGKGKGERGAFIMKISFLLYMLWDLPVMIKYCDSP